MSTTPGERRSDEALLEAAAGGDRAALRVLYERHAPWLFVRLSRRCADTSIVEDVVQDTFVAVWRRAQTYRGTGEVATWIWGIGIRRLIDRLHRPPFPAFTFERERAEPSAEEKVLLAIEYGDLAPALQRLSPELRAVLQARVLDGLSTREAASPR